MIRERILDKLTEGKIGITTASVNKYLKSKGVKEKLYRGNGYYYFGGENVGYWYSSSVYVNHISSIPTVEGWYEEWKSLANDHRNSEVPSEEEKNKPFKFKLGNKY